MENHNPIPRLSIIVPLLNEAGQLPSLLRHLRVWEKRGCEVILVDGGSTDGSLPSVRASGLKVLSAPRGRARQMNAGAAAAMGDILLFLHADTRLCHSTDHGANQSADHGADQSADTLIQGALAKEDHCWGRFDVHIDGNHWMLPLIGWLMNQRSRLTGLATGDQCLFVTAKTFRLVQGFPDQPLMEDIELCRRLRRISPPACLRQKVTTSGRRWLDRGVWSTIWLMWRLRWAYWRGTPAEQLLEHYR